MQWDKRNLAVFFSNLMVFICFYQSRESPEHQNEIVRYCYLFVDKKKNMENEFLSLIIACTFSVYEWNAFQLNAITQKLKPMKVPEKAVNFICST